MTGRFAGSKERWLAVSLTLLAAVALLQQQLLARRPPRLLAVAVQPIRSGAAALDVTFSRPMDRATVADSPLEPKYPHRWFGRQDRMRLLLESGDPVSGPVRLDLRGQDLRRLPMTPQSLWWDPRPFLLAVAPGDEGERLLMRLRDGRWRPLMPAQQRILQVEPLGDGRGVAVVGDDAETTQQVLFRRIDQRSLSGASSGLDDPALGPLETLESGSLLFVHLSANQHGDLLIQLGGFEPGSDRIWILDQGSDRRRLALEASGALRLLPDGTGLVLPSFDGLELLPLESTPGAAPRQTLPGSREVKAFCSGSGRALLVRHWPDYRRSVELVIPGRPPRQVWIGEAGVMAAACDNGGERLWLVLREAGQQARDRMLLLDAQGRTLLNRSLNDWRLTSGAELDFDPVSDQLLTVVRRPGEDAGRVALISGRTLDLTVLDQPAVLARWLPAGGAWAARTRGSR